MNRVKRIIGENKNSETFSAIYSVDSIIANSLIQLGIPASLKGYRYVATGIKRATEDQGVLEGVTKILYPDIARNMIQHRKELKRQLDMQLKLLGIKIVTVI